MPKRVFDIAIALLLLLLLSPLLMVVAAWVKLDSPGPVFFRQQRVGRYGVPFSIHKFRTMQAEAAERTGSSAASNERSAPNSASLLTVGADPRITRAGRWLRNNRIDELPQLIDVLQGTMSMVGPRPEVPRYVAHYPPDLHSRVLSVRPGITDPASLAHINEATWLAQAADPEREYIERILPAKLAQAAAYAERATLATDVGVLWQSLRLLMGYKPSSR